MTDLTTTPLTNLPVSTVVTLTFYFVTAVYIIFTAVFYYHWKSYSSDTKVTAYTYVLYFCTTIPLIIVMAILAFLIE